MEIILEELEKKKCWKSSLKTQCRRNGIDPSYASCFTIVKIRKFFENPPHIDLSDKPRSKSSVWLENQLKAYQWLLICLSAIKGVLIKNFVRNQRVQTLQEWTQLSLIFNKEETVLQYEGLKLVSEKEGIKRKWEEEESLILSKIVKEEPDSNKWNEIARRLFDLSEKRFFRTGKQCRQRWFNHLDPNKKKGEWQPTEDKFIADYIIKKGKKWSEIAKSLENQRTEHMIKNRFKTLMIRLKKQNPSVRSENELLLTLIKETEENIEAEEAYQRELEEHEHEQNERKVKEEDHRLNLEGLPIQDEGGFDDQFGIRGQEVMDRINPSNYKDIDLQQVMTPCPIIYQTFTPTFLNTPHALPYLCSFGKFDNDKNDNLFLKNN